MIKAQSGAATATGDTTKTSMGTLTVPSTARRIIGIWAYAVAGAGLTTLENASGILELESDDMALQPLQLPLDVVVVVTSGVATLSPRVWPVSIPVKGQEKITGYITMDLAQTIALKGRFGLIYEAV